MRQAPSSPGELHSEYCRTRSSASMRSMWAPGDHAGRVSPAGLTRVSATTSSATTSAFWTTSSASCSRTMVRVVVDHLTIPSNYRKQIIVVQTM